MSTEKARPLLYQADLRSTEALSAQEASQLRERRQLVMQRHEFIPNLSLQKYWPLAISCCLLLALIFIPNQVVDNTTIELTGYELSSLIEYGSGVVQDESNSVFDENWALYNDWVFYEWLAEEQLAGAF